MNSILRNLKLFARKATMMVERVATRFGILGLCIVAFGGRSVMSAASSAVREGVELNMTVQDDVIELSVENVGPESHFVNDTCFNPTWHGETPRGITVYFETGNEVYGITKYADIALDAIAITRFGWNPVTDPNEPESIGDFAVLLRPGDRHVKQLRLHALLGAFRKRFENDGETEVAGAFVIVVALPVIDTYDDEWGVSSQLYVRCRVPGVIRLAKRNSHALQKAQIDGIFDEAMKVRTRNGMNRQDR